MITEYDLKMAYNSGMLYGIALVVLTIIFYKIWVINSWQPVAFYYPPPVPRSPEPQEPKAEEN